MQQTPAEERAADKRETLEVIGHSRSARERLLRQLDELDRLLRAVRATVQELTWGGTEKDE